MNQIRPFPFPYKVPDAPDVGIFNWDNRYIKFRSSYYHLHFVHYNDAPRCALLVFLLQIEDVVPVFLVALHLVLLHTVALVIVAAADQSVHVQHALQAEQLGLDREAQIQIKRTIIWRALYIPLWCAGTWPETAEYQLIATSLRRFAAVLRPFVVLSTAVLGRINLIEKDRVRTM